MVLSVDTPPEPQGLERLRGEAKAMAYFEKLKDQRIVNFGAGVASCSCTVAPDPYTFGTPFAFSFGGGLRYVPGGRFQLPPGPLFC